MLKIILWFVAATTITGCASYTPYEYQIPDINNIAKEPMYISVIDQRGRVKKGKSEDFIGVYREAFGIPISKSIRDISSPDDPLRNSTLADFILIRIVDGIKGSGGIVNPKDILDSSDSDFIKKTMKDNDVKNWIILTLNEWYFSTDMHFITSFNFDTNVDLKIYNSDANIIYNENFKSRDVIEEHSDRHNDVLSAYKNKLLKIFNSNKIEEILSN